MRLTGRLRAGAARHRPGADRDRAAAPARRCRASSSSSSGRACRRCRWASARWSPTWRRNTAPPPASSRSTSSVRTTCARPGATEAQLAPCRGLRPAPGLLARSRGRAALHGHARHRSRPDRRRASPGRGGRRTGCRRDRGPSRPTTPVDRRARPGRPDVDRARDGAVAIAAITSCTNTTDPRMLVAAGLLARKARRLGLKPPSWVKTSLGPGSPAAAHYLARAGLLDDLEALGFGIVGFGCTTCIGNSGPLVPEMAEAIEQRGVMAAVAVLSGNRNFPGRVHRADRPAFLASPPLVVAYALAGDVDLDICRDPIGHDAGGRAGVSRRSLADATTRSTRRSRRAPTRTTSPTPTSDSRASDVWQRSRRRRRRSSLGRALDLPPPPALRRRRRGGARSASYVAHPLHRPRRRHHHRPHLPGRAIPAAQRGRQTGSSRAARTRATSTSSRRAAATARSCCAACSPTARSATCSTPAAPPGWTIHAPSGEIAAALAAAERYRAEGRPAVIVAGEHYGTGSSRDWAAKGPACSACAPCSPRASSASTART